jgi:hypothetical protein
MFNYLIMLFSLFLVFHAVGWGCAIFLNYGEIKKWVNFKVAFIVWPFVMALSVLNLILVFKTLRVF